MAVASPQNFLRWREPLCVTGPASPAAAAARLKALLSSGRFSVRDRLVGSLKESRLRVWKENLAGYAGDVVEFDGVLRADGAGTVIEGTLRYRLHTKIQFSGLLLTGLGIVAAGLLRQLYSADGHLLALGAFVTVLTLIWIYAGRKTRHLQVRFIADQLNAVIAQKP